MLLILARRLDCGGDRGSKKTHPRHVLTTRSGVATLLYIAGAFLTLATAQPAGENTGKSQQALRGGSVITGFVGVVELSGVGSCTGSMIAPNAVLTAAHCFDSAGAGGASSGSASATVRYHDPDVGRRSVFSGSAMWRVPSEYEAGAEGPGSANSDIGLLIIPGRFTGTDYRDYLRIYSGAGETLETRLRAYGAGFFTYSGRTDDLLRTQWFEVENVEKNHLVIDHRDKVSPCGGDSGGPLIFTARSGEGDIPTVVGVLSGGDTDESEGRNCGNNDPPFDDSFYSRTNWSKLKSLTRRAGLSCSLHDRAPEKYRRCFTIPFINDASAEGFRRETATAIAVSAVL